MTPRTSRSGTLPTGEPCSDAASYGRPEWAEHDHGACLDALAESIDFERLAFTQLSGALRAGGFGAVQEVGVVHVADIEADYLLYKANVPDASAPGGWGHEWVCVLIAPPSEPRRSQGYPSYGTLLAAVGHDIDVAVKLQAGDRG